MFHETQTIEIIMRKETTITEYINMKPQAEKKGWKVQAYEIGFYNDGFKQEIKDSSQN